MTIAEQWALDWLYFLCSLKLYRRAFLHDSASWQCFTLIMSHFHSSCYTLILNFRKSLFVYRLVHAPVIRLYRAKAGFDSQTESLRHFFIFLFFNDCIFSSLLHTLYFDLFPALEYWELREDSERSNKITWSWSLIIDHCQLTRKIQRKWADLKQEHLVSMFFICIPMSSRCLPSSLWFLAYWWPRS